jgi:hypothetical protein
VKRSLLVVPLLCGCVPETPLVVYRPVKVVYGRQIIKPEPETLAIPSLHGPDFKVPVTHIHKIQPLGWAMLIDFNRMDERTTTLYLKACQDNPKLEGEVNRLLGIKAHIGAKSKAKKMGR